MTNAQFENLYKKMRDSANHHKKSTDVFHSHLLYTYFYFIHKICK